MQGLQRDRYAGMNGLLVTATVAPLLAAPSLQSEQVSQMVLGEGAEVLEISGEMLRVRTLLDDYAGWIAAGYVAPLPLAEVEHWLANAAWSDGALLSDSVGIAIRAPHRARLILDGDDRVRLPAGGSADVIAGSVRRYDDMVSRARAIAPADWAWGEFAGTPYLWGGITGAGIDCSGLTQNTFLARGVTLPRDASLQAAVGRVVDPVDRRTGDLLFFRSRDRDRISHVGILGQDEQMVHSTVEVGGVIRESLAANSRAHALLARLVAVRRVD